MPTYSFACSCGETRELFCKVSELEAKRPLCHGPMQTVIQPVSGYVQMECRYICPKTRQKVTSWRQRQEIFKEHNLRDASDWNPDKEIAKKVKQKQEWAKLASQLPGANNV